MQAPIAKELVEQTDRGMAIIGAAFLDDRLRGKLRAVFKHDKKAIRALFKDMQAPFVSCYNTTNCCRALGLIDEPAYADMLIINTIRNKFAHWTSAEKDAKPGDYLEELTFQTPKIVEKCGKLTLPDYCVFNRGNGVLDPPRDARERYLIAVLAVNLHLG